MPLLHAYLDESGDLPDEHPILTIAVLTTGNPSQIHVRRILKKVRQKILKKKLRHVPELKFNTSDAKTRERVLRAVGEEGGIELLVGVLDKEGRRPGDDPALYGRMAGELLRERVAVGDRVRLRVDKKYTSPERRRIFNQAVESVLASSGVAVAIEHLESHRDSLLQVTDFVAGAGLRKFSLGEGHYFELVEPKVVLLREFRLSEIKRQ